MGGTESNCCGSRPALQIHSPEDPDSGIMGRKRRFQNTDQPQLLPQDSLSQDSFYDPINQQTHSFQITGNITVSSNITNELNLPLPYGITVNINRLSHNDTKNTKNTYVYTPNTNNNNKPTPMPMPIPIQPTQKKPTTPPIKQSQPQKHVIPIEIKQPIINPLINVKNNENTINYNNNYSNNWIENYTRDNDSNDDDIDTLKNTDNDNEDKTEDEDDDMESIISYLSNAPNSENENKYDLDCMQTLELQNENICVNNNNEIKIRKGSNNNLFNVQDVQNWNTNDMTQLEMEMRHEMRRLSSGTSNQQTNMNIININDNLTNIDHT